jgi:hypothetical protein
MEQKLIIRKHLTGLLERLEILRSESGKRRAHTATKITVQKTIHRDIAALVTDYLISQLS